MANASQVMTIESLRSVPLFASLDDKAARLLRDLMRVREVPAGTLLFKMDDPGDALYLIEGGRVRIYIHDGDGENVTLAELGDGDFFGEMAIIDGKPRSANAAVIEQACLAVLAREDFLRFVRENPDVALEMVSAISDRLRRTDELLRQRVSRNVNEEDAARMTLADRLADNVSSFGGSWQFIGATILFVVIWVWFNSMFMHNQGIDPFPYSFLDVINGIVAALLTPIILISQNRQAEKDRLRADLDYQINLKNELALGEVLRRLDVLESERLPLLFAQQNALFAGAKPQHGGDGDENSTAS
jgi:CRP/FNR family cyclic AMP-dependent transcriptional regulator